MRRQRTITVGRVAKIDAKSKRLAGNKEILKFNRRAASLATTKALNDMGIRDKVVRAHIHELLQEACNARNGPRNINAEANEYFALERVRFIFGGKAQTFADLYNKSLEMIKRKKIKK